MTPTHRSHDMTDKLREALNAVQQAAADLQREIDHLAEIKATIRVTALRGGATTDEAEAMVRGERSFVDFLAKLCEARAALAAAPQPAPAPAADVRDEIERIICDAFTCDLRGRGDEDGAFWQTAADALLADGWTRGGDAAGLREALSPEDREWINNRADELFRKSERQRGGVRPATITPMDCHDYFVIDATAERIAALARLSAPETLAWAVVGEDGSLIGINYDRETAQHLCNPGERVVRVAIRIVEDEA